MTPASHSTTATALRVIAATALHVIAATALHVMAERTGEPPDHARYRSDLPSPGRNDR